MKCFFMKHRIQDTAKNTLFGAFSLFFIPYKIFSVRKRFHIDKEKGLQSRERYVIIFQYFFCMQFRNMYPLNGNSTAFIHPYYPGGKPV